MGTRDRSGLFQELSHLLITDCDLRVLVSYPDNSDQLDAELKYLAGVVSGTDRSAQHSETDSILFIAGWRDTAKGRIGWWGYVYDDGVWKALHRVAPDLG